MRVIQFVSSEEQPAVGVVSDEGNQIQVINGATDLRQLALDADAAGSSLGDLIRSRLGPNSESYDDVLREKRVRLPLTHPDPAHCLVTGTGLTHLGSAKARNSMHSEGDSKESTSEPVTDSMKLFQMGVAGGKPDDGSFGTQPEWFFKGTGHCLVPPEHPIESPSFALDGGEEAELVGLYVIGPGGTVLRVGFALGNEFSDHVMERQNYLYLAHSKIRGCSFGPEVWISELPSDIQGTVRILRDGEVHWEEPFVTGEDNMSYWIRNLEHHHFKYSVFRQPGDVHCHYFGTATLSFTAGIRTQAGDIFEVSAPPFARPLRNPLRWAADEPVEIRSLEPN